MKIFHLLAILLALLANGNWRTLGYDPPRAKDKPSTTPLVTERTLITFLTSPRNVDFTGKGPWVQNIENRETDKVKISQTTKDLERTQKRQSQHLKEKDQESVTQNVENLGIGQLEFKEMNDLQKDIKDEGMIIGAQLQEHKRGQQKDNKTAKEFNHHKELAEVKETGNDNITSGISGKQLGDQDNDKETEISGSNNSLLNHHKRDIRDVSANSHENYVGKRDLITSEDDKVYEDTLGKEWDQIKRMDDSNAHKGSMSSNDHDLDESLDVWDPVSTLEKRGIEKWDHKGKGKTNTINFRRNGWKKWNRGNGKVAITSKYLSQEGHRKDWKKWDRSDARYIVPNSTKFKSYSQGWEKWDRGEGNVVIPDDSKAHTIDGEGWKKRDRRQGSNIIQGSNTEGWNKWDRDNERNNKAQTSNTEGWQKWDRNQDNDTTAQVNMRKGWDKWNRGQASDQGSNDNTKQESQRKDWIKWNRESRLI